MFQPPKPEIEIRGWGPGTDDTAGHSHQDRPIVNRVRPIPTSSWERVWPQCRTGARSVAEAIFCCCLRGEYPDRSSYLIPFNTTQSIPRG
jgi:hypothetical protein